jgi:hypothetical protein
MRATVHTIEAIIGTLILLVGVISIYPIEDRQEFYFSDQSHNCLKYMDQQGLLRHYAYNNMIDSLNSSLRSCLPGISDFTFQICSTLPCTTTLPANKTTFLSSYLLAGESDYDTRIISLWVWLR